MHNTHFDLESIELTKLPISVTEILDDYILVKHGLQVETFRDDMLKDMVIRIKTCVLAEEIDNHSKVITIKLSFPVYQSWWQHFKGEVFPVWLRNRFPPQFNYVTKKGSKKVTFRRYATYPKANILFPNNTGSLVRYKSTIESMDKEANNE